MRDKPTFPNEWGRRMQHWEMYAALGLDPKAHLPAQGLAQQLVNGTAVYVLPPSGRKHRVIAVCACGAHVPFGRIEQHKTGRKHRGA